MTFLDRIAAQAAADPHAVAVLDGDTAVTYAELWERAGRTAARLTAAGVGPGSRVAVAAGRGAAHVVAALGSWRSGAAVVPLDPAATPLRREQVLRAAAPAATIGGDGTVERHGGPGPDDTAPLGLDRCATDGYYVFTSGSTGRPKGIAMPRAALDNLVDWQLSDLGERPHRRVAWFAPVAFDVSLQEIVCTLAAGGTLAVVPEEIRARPDAFLDWLAETRIEVLHLPYVALQMLAVQAATSPLTARLRLTEVITAGEVLKCTPDIVRMFLRLPGARLTNQYGPSETHVVTRYALPGDPALWPALPPLGTAVPGVRVTLRDAEGAEVAPGEQGELCVGGIVLRGYVGEGAAEATARALAGGHYRTGDHASERAGLFSFAGRKDHQVKIDGHRVEPEGVESVLLEHPGVREAVCLVTGRESLARSLAAIVVGSAGQAELQAFLHARLPASMVPRRFVVVDELPLTSTGKADRLAAERLLAPGRL
ncbi:AMP-binding protein [Streptomyces sp. NPDC050400]|uniref:AMP-binding protein n=1 Tax=Streptomyces sp. NPDC050400 TaxID=3365610 RepID=UPI0037929FC9